MNLESLVGLGESGELTVSLRQATNAAASARRTPRMMCSCNTNGALCSLETSEPTVGEWPKRGRAGHSPISTGLGRSIAHESSGRLTPAPVGCDCALDGPGHRVARVGGCFLSRPAYRPEYPSIPLATRPTPSVFPSSTAVSGRAQGEAGGERCPSTLAGKLKSAPPPGSAEIRSESGG